MIEEVFNHFKAVNKALEKLNEPEVIGFTNKLSEFFKGGNSLFIGGNGGSYSIAEHFCTDWTKGVFTATQKRIRVLSLNSVSSTQTAIANDLGYEHSLSFNFDINANDVDAIFLISSSGKSPNVIRAAKMAKERGNQLFALTGFGESELYRLADFAITVHSQDFQVIEDVHAILGHAIYKYLITSFQSM